MKLSIKRLLLILTVLTVLMMLARWAFSLFLPILAILPILARAGFYRKYFAWFFDLCFGFVFDIIPRMEKTFKRIMQRNRRPNSALKYFLKNFEKLRKNA